MGSESSREVVQGGNDATVDRREQILSDLLTCGAIAVIRMTEAKKLMHVVEAIREGGITAIEITMTTPGALEAIEETATRLGDAVQIGAGSVLDAGMARRALDAGAQYLVSPIFKPELVDIAHAGGVPAMPGAFSPTEMQRAHEAGADVVKVFPAELLGMSFLRAVKAPLPHLRLMPTGGVTLTNAGEWLQAGAWAVGIGSALLDKEAIAEGRFGLLTENARILRRTIDAARTRSS